MIGWIADRLKDLLYGPGNHYLDTGRVLSVGGAMTMLGAVIWDIHLKKPIDLMALGTGSAAMLTACAAFLAAKTWDRTSP